MIDISTVQVGDIVIGTGHHRSSIWIVVELESHCIRVADCGGFHTYWSDPSFWCMVWPAGE